MSEYAINIKVGETEFSLQTDKRKLARAVKELSAENENMTVGVTRTAKRDVKFSKLD